MRILKKLPRFIYLQLEHYRIQMKYVGFSPMKRFFLFFHFCYCFIVEKCTIKEYCDLRFYSMPHKERAKYMTYFKQLKLCRKLNTPDIRRIFNYKDIFDEYYKDLVGREFLSVDNSTKEEIENFIKKHGAVLKKPLYSAGGANISKISSVEEVYNKKGHFVLEEIIKQHHIMAELNESSVNTIRVSIICCNGIVKIISAALRMGIAGMVVDNASSGGVFAEVNPETGKVFTDVINFKGDSMTTHPDSKIVLKGFQVPCWEEVKKLVETATLRISNSGILAWDIAITENGPVIIEGNDTQNNILIQLASGIGKYPMIKEFLNSATLS